MPENRFEQPSMLGENNQPLLQYSHRSQSDDPDPSAGQEWETALHTPEGRTEFALAKMTPLTDEAYHVNGRTFIDNFSEYFDGYKEDPTTLKSLSFMVIMGFIAGKPDLRALLKDNPSYDEYQDLRRKTN